MQSLPAIVLFAASSFAIAQNTAPPPRHDARALAAAINHFGADLLMRLAPFDRNTCASPVSVAVTLLMALQGAREETRRELAALLHLGDWAPPEIAATSAQLLERLREPAERVEVAIANDLWPQAGHPLRADFLQAMASQFGAEVTAVDFAKDAAASCKLINARIAATTRGRIPDLLSPAMLPGDTKLVLTNAVYFHANWSSPFAEAATKDGSFTLADGAQVDTPLMNQVGLFPLAETDDLQVLWLNYIGSRFRLAVALPRGKGTLEQAMAALLQPAARARLQAKTQNRQVTLTLPRFRCEVSLDLGTELGKLGLQKTMAPEEANFGGIDDGHGQLYLARVIHRVWLDVAEKGTEAAAATAALMPTASAARPEPPAPAVFRADHPFAYALIDGSTDLCWFAGRVADPRPRGN